MDEAQITDQKPQEGQETASPKAEDVTFINGQQKSIVDARRKESDESTPSGSNNFDIMRMMAAPCNAP